MNKNKFLRIGIIFLIIIIIIGSIFSFLFYYFTNNLPFHFGGKFPEVVNENTISRKLGFHEFDCLRDSGCRIEYVWGTTKNESIPILQKISLDENYPLRKRKAAIDILGVLEGKNNEGVFFSVMNNEENDDSLRASAIEWLGRFQSQIAKESIVNIFLNSDDFDFTTIGYSSYSALLNYEPDEYIAYALLEGIKKEKITDLLKFRILNVLHNDYGNVSEPIRDLLFNQATEIIRDSSNSVHSINAALTIFIINFDKNDNIKNIQLFKNLLAYQNPGKEVYRYPYTAERKVHVKSSYLLSSIFPNKCDILLRYYKMGNFYAEDYENETVIHKHNDACIIFWRNFEFD